MNLAEPDSASNLRRAALTVHALPPMERDWLLAQLGDAYRASLQDLLAELASLGIPQDPQLVRQALAVVAPVNASSGNSFDAQALCQALAAEPSTRLRNLWVAALGAAEREAVLALWASPLEATPQAASSLPWTAALQGAVLDSWREAARPKESA